MIEVTDSEGSARLHAARAGDQVAFQHITDPFRHELLVHCYRLLGSLEDAEDSLQETLLRAWRRLDSFEGRDSLRSLRAWLYKIATNASLDALGAASRAGRRRRTMPTTTNPPANPGDPFPQASQEYLWLEPLPDALIDERPTFNPEARYEARESVTLAFLAALQYLPGRQRAVLILRDVLGWRAKEVAELLDTSTPAVNSALERARSTMKERGINRMTARTSNPDTQVAALLTRYVAAWEAADSAALVALLHEDAVMTMPPMPLWYRGREAIRWFLDTYLFADGPPRKFRLVATEANSAPAFGVYHLEAGDVYRLAALHVLTIEDGRVSEIHDFISSQGKMFRHFSLPLTLTD